MDRHNFSKTFIIAVLILALFSGCKKSAPNEKKISEDLASARINLIEIGNMQVDMQIGKVDIEKRKTDEKQDISYVTIQLKNEDLIAIRRLVLTYNYYDKGGWILDYFDETEDIIFTPLKGITNEVAEENLAKKYKSYKQISHNTDLGTRQDVLVYEYIQETETCSATGKAKVNYSFVDGIWTYIDTIEEVASIEWHPTGQWRFDINTFYIRINILSVDNSGKKIVLQYDGSVWQSEADSGAMANKTLSFTETAEGLLIETFNIYYDSWYDIEKKITLLIKRDNIYFKNAFGSFVPVNWPRR